jgi:hypothetical protein
MKNEIWDFPLYLSFLNFIKEGIAEEASGKKRLFIQ